MGGHATEFRKDMKFARCDEYYGFWKATADIRSYEIPEVVKLRKGAKLGKVVKARTIRNSEIPSGTRLGEVGKATKDLSEDLQANLRANLWDLHIKEPRTTINWNNCHMCEAKRPKNGILAVLFERTEKPSLPGMAVGEKQNANKRRGRPRLLLLFVAENFN
jgi:hypothetical protein